jgi:hypothetical protein
VRRHSGFYHGNQEFTFGDKTFLFSNNARPGDTGYVARKVFTSIRFLNGF